MRLRNIPGSDERIAADPYTIQTDGTNGTDFAGYWASQYFHNDYPIHLEIGMGNYNSSSNASKSELHRHRKIF